MLHRSGAGSWPPPHLLQEFNHGLVLSAAPLLDNQMVEVSGGVEVKEGSTPQVRIDKKINSWSGSIEVGVTQCDPNTLESPFPSR